MLFGLRRVTWYNVASIFGMHLFAMGAGLATNAIFGMQSFIDFGSLTHVVKDPAFWLTHLLTTVTAVLPVQAVEWWQAAYGVSFRARLYRMDALCVRGGGGGGGGCGGALRAPQGSPCIRARARAHPPHPPTAHPAPTNCAGTTSPRLAARRPSCATRPRQQPWRPPAPARPPATITRAPAPTARSRCCASLLSARH